MHFAHSATVLSILVVAALCVLGLTDGVGPSRFLSELRVIYSTGLVACVGTLWTIAARGLPS